VGKSAGITLLLGYVPKYRKKTLYGANKRRVKEVIQALVDKKEGIEIVEGTVCSDHIHLCMRIAPKHSASSIVGYLKGKSALMLQDTLPECRKNREREKSFWARGYYINTVGINEATIKDYIKRQDADDRKSR
jgi:putative transposase